MLFPNKKEPLNTYIMFRATKEQREILNNIAKENGLKTSEFIKNAINEYIEKLKKEKKE